MQNVTRPQAQNGDEIGQLRQRVAELEAQLAEREQQVQATQYAVQEMADVIDRIGDVFFAVDREWRYLYINPKAVAVAGADGDNLLGKTIWETFPQLLGTHYEAAYRRAMEQQIPVHLEERGVISGRWYETFVYPSERGLSIYGRDISARKEAEEALREQQAQAERQLVELQGIYATTPAGLCYLDTDLRYISISNQLAQWSAIDPADLIGKKLEDVVTEEGQAFVEILRQVIESGEPFINQELRAPLPSEPDRMRDWLLNYYPVRNSSGQIVGINSIVQDVTEWKQSQREREEALALLDAFFSLAPIGLAFVDQDLRFVRINDALAKMNGLPVKAHLNKRPDELPINLPDLPEILQIWRQLMQKGEVVRGMEVSGETPAAPGVTRYWLEYWYPVRVQEQVIGMGIVVNEITERKFYEQSLQQSEERFRRLADAMPHLVWIANADGQVEYYNRRRQEFQGIAKTTDGWDWAPLIHPNDLHPTITAWQKAAESGQVYQMEHRLCRANGDFEWYLSRAVPLRNAKGEIDKWYGTATNIHESKTDASERERLLAALEQEQFQLRELTATLEDRVYQGIEKIRMLAARLTLAEHEERKRIAQILHDHIQQMLYAVQMRVHLLELALDDEQASTLQIHTDEMKRLTNEAIRSVRTLSVELSPPILENEGLPEAIRWLGQQMEEIHGLHTRITVKGDCGVENKNLRVMLFQAGRELLFNVVKHASAKEATVDLKRLDGQIVITVSDQGKGVEAGALSQRKVGFGLASIRERLDLFNGQIEIESAPGQGMRVTITCPLS